MKNLILHLLVPALLLFITILPVAAQNRQISSGLLLGGAAGTLDYEFIKKLNTDQIGRKFDETFNYDLHLGYRFRIQQSQRFFWDLDVLAGIKSIQKATILDFSEIYVAFENEKRHLNYYMALSPSANIWIYKKLYAGLGIEPTCYFYRSKDSGIGFDLPATVKIGYDFSKFSIEGTVKMGLIRHSMENLLQRNRKKEFQLSVYIPLKH